VTRWCARALAALLVAELAVPALVDSSSTACPGWAFTSKSGYGTPFWLVAIVFTGLPALVVWHTAARWRGFAKEVVDGILNSPEQIDWNHNAVYAVAIVSFFLLSTFPAWLMLSSCSPLFGHLLALAARVL
jgi:hypothetical protein